MRTYTSITPTLAKIERSTAYTLARRLTIVRFLSGKPTSAHGTYYVMDATMTVTESPMVYARGLTFSNAI